MFDFNRKAKVERFSSSKTSLDYGETGETGENPYTIAT